MINTGGKRVGVLITNLGTPDEPQPSALRRYLAEFLSDPRVVNKPRWLWLPILHGIILRIRPARSAKAYQRVWTKEGSPLLAIGRKQQIGLQQKLTTDVPVVLAMRYGNPSIASGLESLRDQGVERIIVLPLYPQYAASTTASTFDAIASTWRHWWHLPELRMISDYHDRDSYINALANSIREYWSEHGQGEYLLLSFHGTPEAMRLAGDPYYDQCHKTAELLRHKLHLSSEQCLLTFQSRFGPEAWLQPYTDKTLERLAGEGVKRVDVVCPGFSADCLETIDEMALENRELFLDAGGSDFHYIPALNDRDDHLNALVELINEHRLTN